MLFGPFDCRLALLLVGGLDLLNLLVTELQLRGHPIQYPWCEVSATPATPAGLGIVAFILRDHDRGKHPDAHQRDYRE